MTTRWIKYSLLSINIILSICGGLLIALGSTIIVAMDDFEPFSGTSTAATLVVLVMVLGILITLVSAAGCCAALKDIKTFSLVYSLLTIILIGLDIALIVWISVEFRDFLDSMAALAKWAWQNNTAEYGEPMTVLETNFGCCGLNGYGDYTSQNELVPSSCCPSSQGCTPAEYQRISGCEGKFREVWTRDLNMMRYGCVGVAVVQIVASTLSCFGANGRRKLRQVQE